jgi:hypothetical protein
VAVALAIIVMYDRSEVRQESGKQARVIDQILADVLQRPSADRSEAQGIKSATRRCKCSSVGWLELASPWPICGGLARGPGRFSALCRVFFCWSRAIGPRLPDER